MTFTYFVCVYVSVHVLWYTVGVRFFFPSCGLRGLNPAHDVWQQVLSYLLSMLAPGIVVPGLAVQEVLTSPFLGMPKVVSREPSDSATDGFQLFLK